MVWGMKMSDLSPFFIRKTLFSWELDSRIKKLHLAIQNPKRMGKFGKSGSILRRNRQIGAAFLPRCFGSNLKQAHSNKKNVCDVCVLALLGPLGSELWTLGSLLLSELFVIQRAVGSFVLRWPEPWSALVLHARPRVNQKWTWRLRCVQPFPWRSSYHRKRCRNRAISNSWRW